VRAIPERSAVVCPGSASFNSPRISVGKYGRDYKDFFLSTPGKITAMSQRAVLGAEQT